MIVFEEIVLIKNLALLTPPLIFEGIYQCFDIAVLTFLSF